MFSSRQLVFLFAACAAPVLCGQAASRETIANQKIEAAQKEADRIKALVALGVESRARLEQAQSALGDAQDAAVLERTLYGDPAKLTDEDEAAMLGAAERRVNRENAKLAQTEALIASGLAPASELAIEQEERTRKQQDYRWAESVSEFRTEEAAWAAPSFDDLELAPQDRPEVSASGMERFDGASNFDEARDLKPLSAAFEIQFNRPLPISADGETDLHRALGFDHRGRVDVAVNPAGPDGLWLREYLRSRNIPYYAFTRAVPGKATAAHIHIGTGSTRLQAPEKSKI